MKQTAKYSLDNHTIKKYIKLTKESSYLAVFSTKTGEKYSFLIKQANDGNYHLLTLLRQPGVPKGEFSFLGILSDEKYHQGNKSPYDIDSKIHADTDFIFGKIFSDKTAFMSFEYDGKCCICKFQQNSSNGLCDICSFIS